MLSHALTCNRTRGSSSFVTDKTDNLCARVEILDKLFSKLCFDSLDSPYNAKHELPKEIWNTSFL